MSAPDPAVIDQVTRNLRPLAIEVAQRYADLHASGYEQRRGGRSGNGGGTDQPDTSRLIAGSEPVRDLLEEAARKTLLAYAMLQGADSALRKVVSAIDARADNTVSDPAVVREVLRAGGGAAKEGRRFAEQRRERGTSAPGSDWGQLGEQSGTA